LENSGVTIVGYADDVVLIARVSCCTSKSVWTKYNGFGVNAIKTKQVLFTAFRHPMLDGVELKISNRKLIWKENIEERRKKAYIGWFACSKAIGKS
uniref:Reverse transcriptase domain-containing protein n=1 Tax=Megaselia scalaris TaxID=36166 RepID=T1GRF6_MEGSC